MNLQNVLFLFILALPCTTSPMWQSIIQWATPAPTLVAAEIEKAVTDMQATFSMPGVCGTSQREGIIKGIKWTVTANKENPHDYLNLNVICKDAETLAILQKKKIIHANTNY